MINWLIDWLLCWVFVSVLGLSPAVASRDHSSSRCAGLSPSGPLPLRSTGSRRAGSVIVAHGPSRSAARGILPDQGPNPRPPHWQADNQPLRHQGSPKFVFWFLVFVFLGPSILQVMKANIVAVKFDSKLPGSKNRHMEVCTLPIPWWERQFWVYWFKRIDESGITRKGPWPCLLLPWRGSESKTSENLVT